ELVPLELSAHLGNKGLAATLGQRIDAARRLSGLSLLAAADEAIDLHFRKCRIDRAVARAAEIGERAFVPALLQVIARCLAMGEDCEADRADVHRVPLLRSGIYRNDIGRSKAVGWRIRGLALTWRNAGGGDKNAESSVGRAGLGRRRRDRVLDRHGAGTGRSRAGCRRRAGHRKRPYRLLRRWLRLLPCDAGTGRQAAARRRRRSRKSGR